MAYGKVLYMRILIYSATSSFVYFYIDKYASSQLFNKMLPNCSMWLIEMAQR